MKKLITIGFLLVSLTSRAEYLAEPYFGLNFYGSEVGHDNLETFPMTLGVRLGFQTLGFIYGIDYSRTSSIELDNNPGRYELSQLGLFGGYKFPIAIAAWMAIVFDAELDGENVNNGPNNGGTANTKMQGGSGIHIGGAWTVMPLINLNFEYRYYQFDDREVSGQGVINWETDAKMYLFSVSVPFTW